MGRSRGAIPTQARQLVVLLNRPPSLCRVHLVEKHSSSQWKNTTHSWTSEYFLGRDWGGVERKPGQRHNVLESLPLLGQGPPAGLTRGQGHHCHTASSLGASLQKASISATQPLPVRRLGLLAGSKQTVHFLFPLAQKGLTTPNTTKDPSGSSQNILQTTGLW